jgi:Fe-S cluster assembly ATP-binding protein
LKGQLTVTEALLQIKNLNLDRDGRQVLRDVNLELYPGQVHTLMGLNGSGKSSLAYTIMGCEGYIPASGQILFEGKELNGLSIVERARLGITLAWQEPARFEGIPVGKYVGVGMKTPNRDHVVAALDAVSLPAKFYGYRSTDQSLSGGERKRIELASVYAMHPRLAILDEPDSGIDVLTLGDIGVLIRRMAAEGCAVLLITHNDELVSVSDAASIMCAGSVIFTGSPLEAHQYFTKRCMAHYESLGSQPWNEADPQVQEAYASNGLRRTSFLAEGGR